jgi:hypothetical protein
VRRPRRGAGPSAGVVEEGLDPGRGAGAAEVDHDDRRFAVPRDRVSIDPVAAAAASFVPPRGLTRPGAIRIEQVRCVANDRLGPRHGVVTPPTMDQVDQIWRIVLGPGWVPPRPRTGTSSPMGGGGPVPIPEGSHGDVR